MATLGRRAENRIVVECSGLFVNANLHFRIFWQISLAANHRFYLGYSSDLLGHTQSGHKIFNLECSLTRSCRTTDQEAGLTFLTKFMVKESS